MDGLLQTLAARLLAGEGSGGIGAEEALACAGLGPEHSADLFAVAGLARALHGPAGFGTCAIINAKSGRCPENCAFCAQSAHYKTHAPVYDLVDTDTLLDTARTLAGHGIARFGIVTSGTGPTDRDLDVLCEAALRIRAETSIGLCASLGLLTPERARRLKEAGFTRYHHNLETARSNFANICTTHDYDQDIETLRVARAAGLSVCSCGIFGLGETWEQRVELLTTVRELDVDSLPLNFLCPVPGTPLGERHPLPAGEALRIIALARLLVPSKEIIVCGGRLSTLGEVQSWALAAGASSLMTGNYLTTRGCGYEADDALFKDLGLARR